MLLLLPLSLLNKVDAAVERVLLEADDKDNARRLNANASATSTQRATDRQKTKKNAHGRVGSHAYAASHGAHGKAAPKPILTWLDEINK